MAGVTAGDSAASAGGGAGAGGSNFAGSAGAGATSGASSPNARPAEQGVRLESLGKGISVADVDEKTNDVVIRRSGRVIERFGDDKSIAEFADKKKLSELDRETLVKLAEIRQADPSARAEVKLTLGPDLELREPEMVNSLAADPERGRVRAEVERYDAEVYAWVEKQKKARELRVEPVEIAALAAVAAEAAETKSADTIEREAPFASPNTRLKAVPPEVGSQYLQVGEKFYHQNNTKAVAFVDRGDKLETASSAPKMAEALVKIAEARGWDEMRVKGTEGFRREVWLEGSVRGIHVDGYKPSELDKVELERRNTFMRDQNSVEVRSEAFQKLSPQEGTRKDPTLASAYGAQAYAERVAEKMHPENRAPFVQSIKEGITRRLANGEPIQLRLNVPEGKLIEHGKANYNFDKEEKPSYYVKLAEANGRERTYWGVGLQKAMESLDVNAGDTLQLRVIESKGVVVEGNVRDATGQVVGRQTVDSHRNEWQATVTAKARTQERQYRDGQAR
jgi:hypothetical protein